MTQKYLLSFPNISFNTDLIPDLNDILPAFTSPFELPEFACLDLGFPWPATNLLPAVPDISTICGNYDLNMLNIKMPSWTAVHMAGGVFLGQILGVINSLWNRLTSLFNGIPAIGSMPSLPAWPGFPDFSLSDLMANNPLPLLNHINLPSFDFSTIQNLVEWDNFLSPAMKAFDALQTSAAGFMALIVDKIKIAVNMVTNWIAVIGGGSFHLSLPTIPTYADLKEMLPDFPTADDVYNLSVPGFPSFSLPSPLIPDLRWPSFEFSFAINNMIMTFLGSNVNTIVNFVRNLPFPIGPIFTPPMPKISDLVGVLPDIPPVCHESVNTGIPCFT